MTEISYTFNGMINTRGVSDNFKIMKTKLNVLIVTDKDQQNGYRVGPSTLNFINNEIRYIRLVNRYVFNTVIIEAIWILKISLVAHPRGTMLIHQTLQKIRILNNNQIINLELPYGLMEGIVEIVNESIKSLRYKAPYLHLDQFEGLSDIGVLKRPDELLERLVGIAETRGDLDATQMRHTRMVPDSLSMTLTIITAPQPKDREISF